MSLIKGHPTLSRYRLLEAPKETTDDYLRERLKRNAFIDIENVAEESSLGWVEILNHLAVGFEPSSFRFGGFVAFQARLDRRRLPAKILNRYFLIEEARLWAQEGQRLNVQAKREKKDALRRELLTRALLDTDLLEVLWFQKEFEIWIGGAGERNRLIFEELWDRTFGLGIRLLAPIALGFEVIPKELGASLIASQASPFFKGEDG